MAALLVVEFDALLRPVVTLNVRAPLLLLCPVEMEEDDIPLPTLLIFVRPGDDDRRLWPFETALDAGEEERWAWVVGMPLASLDISILDVECPELERPPLLRMLPLLLILPDSQCGERGDDLRP